MPESPLLGDFLRQLEEPGPRVAQHLGLRQPHQPARLSSSPTRTGFVAPPPAGFPASVVPAGDSRRLRTGVTGNGPACCPVDSFHHEGEKPFQPGLRQVPTRRQIASAHTTTRAAPSGGPKPTIVLEPGAWADSGSRDARIQRLQAAGSPPSAPPAPPQGLIYY